MESNGKSVTRDGRRVSYETAPIFWGEPGTNGQHSVLSTHSSRLRGSYPATSIAFLPIIETRWGNHHDLLMANVFAQTRALAFGKPASEVKAEGTPIGSCRTARFEGNRPSNTILADRLTPAILGSLVAAYEHSVFTQGVVWQIDPLTNGRGVGQVLATAIGADLAPARTRIRPRQLDD